MNYCDKIQYAIYKAEKGLFCHMLQLLLSQLRQDREILRLILFGATENKEQYIERRNILYDILYEWFEKKMPAFSYISQAPLEGELVMEVHYYIPDENDRVFFRTYNKNPYVLVENEMGRFLFSGGWQGDMCTDIYTQSKNIFIQIERLFEKEHFEISSIVRQWNYIENITDCDNGNQNYQMFNNARSEFYSKDLWKDGYPAATGIGCKGGGILIDIDAVMFFSDSYFVTPIDNKLQKAAHAYSCDVLFEAYSKKTTPKFERAKSMTFNNKRVIYLSGTAAIRGEESIIGLGIEKQLVITMENIYQLLDNARIVLLRVYLKNEEDYGIVKRYFSYSDNNIAISYLKADVCRDELLIEIEGIAIA